MTAAEVMRARILMLSDVTTLVDDRVWNLIAEQSPDLPAVRVQRVDEFENGHLRGSNGVLRARVQVESFAATLAEAYEVDAAIHGDGAGSGVAFWTGDLGSPAVRVDVILPDNVHEIYEPEELNQFRVVRDYFVHYRLN